MLSGPPASLAASTSSWQAASRSGAGAGFRRSCRRGPSPTGRPSRAGTGLRDACAPRTGTARAPPCCPRPASRRCGARTRRSPRRSCRVGPRASPRRIEWSRVRRLSCLLATGRPARRRRARRRAGRPPRPAPPPCTPFGRERVALRGGADLLVRELHADPQQVRAERSRPIDGKRPVLARIVVEASEEGSIARRPSSGWPPRPRCAPPSRRRR